MCLTPLSCQLMGWRGADGSGSANKCVHYTNIVKSLELTSNVTSGVHFFCGGVLMLLGGLLEFFLGNTFAFVVFCSYGKRFPNSPPIVRVICLNIRWILFVGRRYAGSRVWRTRGIYKCRWWIKRTILQHVRYSALPGSYSSGPSNIRQHSSIYLSGYSVSYS